jgi:hypothetical protein
MKYTTPAQSPNYAAKSPVPAAAYAAAKTSDADAKVFSMTDLQDLMKYYSAQEGCL